MASVTPALADQIAAVEQAIADERDTLAMARRLKLDVAFGTSFEDRERRIVRLNAAANTLRRLQSGAPPQGAAA